MPSATTHDKIAVVSGLALVPLGAGVLLLMDTEPQRAMLDTALLVGSHLVCSYWLSPDLDIDSAIDDRWGPLRPIWLPYQKLVPHRHWLSHSGISALLRLLYLLLSLALIAFLVGLVLPGEVRQFVFGTFEFVRDRPREVFLVLLGAIISDLVHTLSDKISTRRKRRLRVKRVQHPRRKSRTRRYRR
jgi:uncharacterized metal-binding protein